MEKVIIIAVVGVLFVVLLKEQKASIAFLLSIAIGIMIIFYIVDYAVVLLDGFKVFEEYFDSSGYYIKLILKMVGITYLCECGIEICKDASQGAIASQIEMLGKVIILVTGLPIILAILEQIMKFEG